MQDLCTDDARAGSGHIINVASFAGFAAAPGINAYGTAKAAVIAMSEMLRAELADAGVEVSALCPAFVKTRLTETMRAPDDSYQRRVERWMQNSGVSPDGCRRGGGSCGAAAEIFAADTWQYPLGLAAEALVPGAIFPDVDARRSGVRKKKRQRR